ncbi:MAG: zinc-ribbon domain-containing protein [Ruminococcus sp.]
MRCSNCGSENKDTNKFCVKCGTKLNQETLSCVSNNTEKNSKLKTFAIIGIVVLAIIVAAVLIINHINKSSSDNTSNNVEMNAETSAQTITEGVSSTIDETSDNKSAVDNTTISDNKNKKNKKSDNIYFFEDKYYFFVDDNGELCVCVFEFKGDSVKYIVYDHGEGYSKPSYTETFPLKWNKDHTYAENDVGMRFVVDYDWKVVQYKTTDMAKLEVLREYSELNQSNLEEFVMDYLG